MSDRSKLGWDVTKRLEWPEGASGHSHDRLGGDTWFGISRVYHPNEPWPPTEARAQEIYDLEYWHATRCDEIPEPLDIVVADAAFNQGVGRVHRMIADMVGNDQPFEVGRSIIALQNMELAMSGGAFDHKDYVSIFMWQRVLGYSKTETWNENARGYMNRLTRLWDMLFPPVFTSTT